MIIQLGGAGPLLGGAIPEDIPSKKRVKKMTKGISFNIEALV